MDCFVGKMLILLMIFSRTILTCFVNDLDLSKYVVNFNLSQASSESKPVKLVVSCVQWYLFLPLVK